jgi:amino acid adenylation domain-containing protein
MSKDFSLEQVDFNPFGTSQIEKVITPLEVQREIWISCALGGDAANLAYNNCYTLILKGEFQLNMLLTAIETLVLRHESLRATFDEEGKKMIIHDYLEPDLKYHDLETLNDEAQALFIQDILNLEVAKVFDLTNGPLLRFSLAQKNKRELVLILTAHHIIADGRSIGFIFEDLGQLYTSLLKKDQSPLPKVYSFSEYVKEFEEHLADPSAELTEQYWLEKFALDIPNTELPLDFLRPTEKTYAGKRLDKQISDTLVNSLRQLSVQQRVTIMSLMLSAFELLLAKISGERDWIIGMPAVGVSQKSHAPMIGHSVHLLPLKAKVVPEYSFVKYLKSRRSELLDDYEHKHFSLGKFLRKLKIKRESNRLPLIGVVFNMDRGMEEKIHFEGLHHRMLSNPRNHENFDLALNISDGSHGMILEWAYNTDLLKEDTIHQWIQSYEELLEGIVSAPETQVGTFIDKAHDEEVLEEWNFTAKTLQYSSFVECFTHVVKQYTFRTAILFGTKKYTYQELEEKTNYVSAHLQRLGVGKGKVVAVVMDRSAEMLMAMLGVMKSGAAFLPIDPSFPQERISYMLENSAAILAIVDKNNAAEISNVPLVLKEALFEGVMNDFTDKIQIDGDDLAYMLYTSGSTGRPKGVKVTHHNLINFLESMVDIFDFSEQERMFAATTVSFDISILELFLPLSTGASVVIAASEVAKDGKQFLEMIHRYEVTFVQGTPVTWRILLASGWDYPLQIKLLCGGEPLPKDLAESLLQRVGAFWNGYGPTETTVISTIKKIENPEDITIGRPIGNTQVLILDENLKKVSRGGSGEIAIAGEGVTAGYHQLEALTQEKFIDNPYRSPGTQLFLTGDLGKINDKGEIVCQGRRDHQLKIRGFRVEPGEIEQVLLEIDEIKEAVVSAYDDQFGQKRLVAFVVRGNFSSQEVERVEMDTVLTWRKQLQDHLPDYMIPQEWLALRELPKTANQKIDRKRLPQPSDIEENMIAFEVNDFSFMEKMISQVWKKALGIAKVRKDDDFFEIGGHSLVSVEVMSLLEKKLGISLPLNSIFRYPTLRGLAAFLEQKNLQEVNYHSLVSIKPNGDKPPLYIVHGAGSVISIYFRLAQVMDEDQPVYGFQPKGLDGVEEPHQSVEEMAAYYIECLLAQNPNGPYRLAGYSFGGYVAYEMSRQLQKMGKQVERLILFDTPYFELEENLSERELWKLAMGKRLTELKFLFQEPKAYLELKQRSIQRKFRAIKKKIGVDEEVKEENAYTEAIRKLTKNHRKIVDLYNLERYDGELILFRVQHRSFYVEESLHYGWDPWVNNVRVVQVSGHHDSLFIEPKIIKEVAEKIQQVLDENDK